MSAVLELLGEVRWRGRPVVGERAQALLAALAYDGCRTVPVARLIELVWGEEGPANGTKGLQVLISRTRSAYGADAIVRDGGGYRLGAAPGEVDSIRLGQLVAEAGALLDGDAAAAAESAAAALALAAGADARVDGGGDDGPLHSLRSAAADEIATARVILARARSRTGSHAEALAALEQDWDERGEDESLLADLLGSEAAVRGPAAALERYEQYRRELRGRLGVNPGERLQALQRELLALDRPVRSGLRYDPTALIGRERDLERLRGLMRSARVVSIVGPGGLGKTRLAHTLARDAGLPVAHVVELVGVTSGEDVVAEVGAVLGVRDSVSSRRTLSAEQRADVRGRIAQRLAQAPSLLVLDNCEHLVGAVAELVAFLVTTTPDLRVLTTSRAPLAIAAEHVYLLDQLDIEAAAQLFRTRAESARPLVALDDEVVAGIVTRLDGLPLAIELAAAKVRVMSVQEIDRRLENRFALLRGGDRSAPDRHQTLLAVIDWSWNLLDAAERRALRRLALFHDGFTLEAAEAVLGDDALEAVQGLVDQSLLKLEERGGSVRYRMLETVREFGQMQLTDAGEDDDARAALRRWAIAYAEDHGARLSGAEQLSAIDALAAEDVNLTDELRGALAAGDRDSLVRLLAATGTFWAIRGEHTRLIMLADAVAETLRDWRPPPALEQPTRWALTMLLSNTLVASVEQEPVIRQLLAELGPGEESRLAGLVRVMLAYDPAGEPGAFGERLERLAVDDDRYTAWAAMQWLSHVRESLGDSDGAVEAVYAALALVGDQDGPWDVAILRTQLSALLMQRGEREQGRVHAEAALAVMRRIGARDDELQLLALLALCAIADGRLNDAEEQLARLEQVDPESTLFGSLAFRQVGRAELALARGELAEGLRLYRECAVHMHELRFPGIAQTGIEPWTLFGDGAALAAHAHYATPADEPYGRELFASCRASALRALAANDAFRDLPVIGLQLFALGAWGLIREALPAAQSLALLALADRLAYVRMSPTFAWERIVPLAEERAPGELARLCGDYRERAPAELLDRVRQLLEQLL